MSAHEFALHWADFQQNPWDETRGDLRAATIAATIVNANPYRKQDAPPAEISDFMFFTADKQKQEHATTFDDVAEFLARGQ